MVIAGVIHSAACGAVSSSRLAQALFTWQHIVHGKQEYTRLLETSQNWYSHSQHVVSNTVSPSVGGWGSRLHIVMELLQRHIATSLDTGSIESVAALVTSSRQNGLQDSQPRTLIILWLVWPLSPTICLMRRCVCVSFWGSYLCSVCCWSTCFLPPFNCTPLFFLILLWLTGLETS